MKQLAMVVAVLLLSFPGSAAAKEAQTLDELVANHAPLQEIRRAAFEHGYHPLAEDGVKRVLDGVTSLSEVSRVVDLTGRV